MNQQAWWAMSSIQIERIERPPCLVLDAGLSFLWRVGGLIRDHDCLPFRFLLRCDDVGSGLTPMAVFGSDLLTFSPIPF